METTIKVGKQAEADKMNRLTAMNIISKQLKLGDKPVNSKIRNKGFHDSDVTARSSTGVALRVCLTRKDINKKELELEKLKERVS